MMNIVSVSNTVKKGFQVYIDIPIDNAFYVTDAQKITVRFPCNEQGLYMQEHKHTSDKNEKDHMVMATVIEGHTPREIAKAKRCKRLYHDLHTETIPNLKMWLR